MARLLVAALAVLALGLGACEGSSAQRDEAGEVTSAGSVLGWDLRIGDCVLLPDGVTEDEDGAEVYDVEVVPCSQEHDAEVYDVFDLPTGGYPGETAVDEAAVDGCLATFAEFIGTQYEESRFDSVWLVPTEGSWVDMGDREVSCLVHDPTGGSLTGSLEAVGDAEGAPSEKPKSDEPPSTGGAGARAPGTTDAGRTVSLWDLAVGDCYTFPEDPAAESVAVVPCTEQHTDEVYETFDLPDGDYPGDDAVAAQAEEGCYAAFERFVGTTYEESTLDFTFFTPTALTWNKMGDREVLCTVIDGQGGELTESVRGAAR